MRFLKNVFSQLHTFILIALLSTVFWAWIFTFVTDTSPEKKITVYFDVPAVRTTELSVELEKDMPDGIKMIRARTFDYAIIDDSTLQQGDIFVIRRSNMEKYLPDLAPLPILANKSGNSVGLWLSPDGIPYGIPVRDAGSGICALPDFVTYAVPGEADEDFFLCFGAKSLHLTSNEGAVDGCAVAVARNIIPDAVMREVDSYGFFH